MAVGTDEVCGQLDSFPDPVAPCESVEGARQRRLNELNHATITGILVRLIVIVAEFLGVWFSGSATLLVDGIASLFDVVSSLVLLAAIRFAARPPDDDHPFGHGRAEPLAGFQLGLLLSATGIWMAIQNTFAITHAPPMQEFSRWVWIIPAGATGLLGFVTLRMHRSGRKSRSSALRAEAMHFQVDTATSLVTAMTLLSAAIWQAQASVLDHLGASLLAVLMIALGVHAAWENLHQLLDRVPQDEDFERVRISALNVDGVIDVEKLQIQHAGPDAHVNIDIEVDPEISVATSHRIAQRVRARIQSDWPFVRDVIVHVEPFYPGDH